MRIKKILNNNVITFEARNGDDNVAMGRGIGFWKKAGEEVDESKIENIFVPNSTMKDVSQLVQSIPYEYFEITDEIIKYARVKLAKPVNSITNLFLADHIFGAVERAKEGIYLKSSMYWEIKRFYKDEADIAEYGMKIIKERQA